MKKKKIKKPNFFLYYLAGPLAILWYKSKTKLIYNKEKIRDGSIILAPHRSYYDFFTVPISIYPKRVHCVATTYWYRNKKLGKFLDMLGTIPRDQYRSDVKSIINIADCLKRKENILIFPEGQMSPYGESLFLPSGLDKLIHKYKPNVYFINTNGSYLNSPKWNPSFGKRAIIEIEKNLLIKSEEVDSLSIEEIGKRIVDVFKENNDLEWVKKHQNYKYKKDEKIKGLENILTYCPKCNANLSYEYSYNKIKCLSCDNTFEFKKDSYNFINNEFNDLSDLFSSCNNKLQNEINNGLILEDEARITFYDSEFNENELFDGIVKMDKDNIYFINKDDETKNVKIELKKVINFVITLNKSFEVPTADTTYRIYTKNKKRCIMYWSFLQEIKNN